jgi:hypothetical protein
MNEPCRGRPTSRNRKLTQDWQGIVTAGFLLIGGFVFLRLLADARAHEVTRREAEFETERRKAAKAERERIRRESQVVTAVPAASAKE